MEDRNSGTEVGFFILCLKIRTAMRWYGLEDMSHWVHAGFWTFIQGFYFLHLLHFASCTPIAQKYPHFLQRHPHAREAPLYVCATIDAASEGYGKKMLATRRSKNKTFNITLGVTQSTLESEINGDGIEVDWVNVVNSEP